MIAGIAFSCQWRLERLVGVLGDVRLGHSVAVVHEPRAGQWRSHVCRIQFSVVFDASVLLWRRRWRRRWVESRLILVMQEVQPDCVVCFAAVNGGWSAWSQCKGYCSGATQSRSCTNPSPANGGAACVGSSQSDCSMPGCAPGTSCTRLIACVANHFAGFQLKLSLTIGYMYCAALSAGATAGIAIGAVGVIAGAAVATACYCKKRRARTSRGATAATAASPATSTTKAKDVPMAAVPSSPADPSSSPAAAESPPVRSGPRPPSAPPPPLAAASAATAAPPVHWQQKWDKTHNRAYWWDQASDTSTWERPADAV